MLERALGKDQSEISTVLENMAECYNHLGIENEAIKLTERAKAICQKQVIKTFV